MEVVILSRLPLVRTKILMMSSRYSGMELMPNVSMGVRTAFQLTPMTEGRGAFRGDSLQLIEE